MANASEASSYDLFSMAMGGMHDGAICDSYDHIIDVENNYYVIRRRGQVYDENLNRDYWTRSYSGPKPGTLERDDIEELMKKRRKS